MKITLLGEHALRLEDSSGPLTIEAESASRPYGPFAMLASGLAVCTHGVLRSWAEGAKLPAADLAIEVAWDFAEEPHRVGKFAVEIVWPGLPEKRRTAASRAARQCAVHHTFEHPPPIEIAVREQPAAVAPPVAAAARAAAR